MDENTLVFAAGNFIMLLDTVTQGLTYLRTLGGAGVGAITAHPSKSYFAVGEKGDSPVIAIYTYPELVLHRILRGEGNTHIAIALHSNLSRPQEALSSSTLTWTLVLRMATY